VARVGIEKLVKTYGEETVVDHVTLGIEEGEFVVLLGPSGCGKTTTLRMIAGLEDITGGTLTFDDTVMNNVPPDRRNVGMVFQNYALYPHMTVAENLSFGLLSQRRPGRRRDVRREIRNLVSQTAELLEIEHVLDHRPKQLSGGQRQRVALGRALIRQPSVFLMDEPLSNLDANLRDRVRMELARLHDRFQVTTVYVTHDQGEALTLADRVVVMNEGKICQVGTPAEVYDLPADTFVAHFIGTPGMNLWTLPCEHRAGEISLGDSVELSREFGLLLDASGERVTLGIRPEHFAPVDDVKHPGAVVTIRLELVEHLGSHLLGHGHVGEAEKQPVVVRLDASSPLRQGDIARLATPARSVHLFDAESGSRLDFRDRALATA